MQPARKSRPRRLPLRLLAVALCAATACATTRMKDRPQPPAPLPLFHTGLPLIDPRETIPDLAVELPYATADNVVGIRLYPAAMPVLLDRDTAAKLGAAQAELATHGLGLKIWDAYRPPEVQQELWRLSGGSGYVADPDLWWSKHCSGRAVDVTLIDLHTRHELPMPSGFDDFSKRAASAYTGRDPGVRRRLGRLQHAMLAAGFRRIDMEWWHFANATHYNRNIAPVPAAEAGIDL